MRRRLVNGPEQESIVCESLRNCFFFLTGGGEGRHLSGQVKIKPGKWILRVTCVNGKCCQNLVSNTVGYVQIQYLIKKRTRKIIIMYLTFVGFNFGLVLIQSYICFYIIGAKSCISFAYC